MKEQMHRDLLHLLQDLAISLDDAEMDTGRLRSIYARVIAEQMQELQAVVDSERKPAAFVDPRQLSWWMVHTLPGQGSEEGGQP